jgi:transposase InsO family protein
MRVHRNAKTTPKTRAVIVQRVDAEGWSVEETAEAFAVSVRTVHKWRRRFRLEGADGLLDRSAAPQRIPHRTSAAREARIVALRATRLAGWQIARRLQLPRATVGAVLRRRGVSRLPPLTAPEPVRRYERERPGELLHLDIKTLGRIGQVGHRIHGERRQCTRGIGWEHVHVCVDDASRVAYVEVLPTLTQGDAVGFLERAVAWFAARGIRSERVLTDNGSAYRSRAFAIACTRLGLVHKHTRPYRPRTNGKAERFIQTLLREWAYRRPYPTSARRRRALAPWVRYYNRKRPHTALNYRAPITRLEEVAA